MIFNWCTDTNVQMWHWTHNISDTLFFQHVGDRLVAQGGQNQTYPSPHNVQIQLTYPSQGYGARVTYVAIVVNQVEKFSCNLLDAIWKSIFYFRLPIWGKRMWWRAVLTSTWSLSLWKRSTPTFSMFMLTFMACKLIEIHAFGIGTI